MVVASINTMVQTHAFFIVAFNSSKQMVFLDSFLRLGIIVYQFPFENINLDPVPPLANLSISFFQTAKGT